ncbi:MAG: PqqD family peptide modification chaperone [Zetaproteobacteria bacterium]|nr:PqqD family peptide modification chaperone [Zetaproteobacteria bacterium]
MVKSPIKKISIAQQRKQQILHAVDAIAEKNQLAFLTTQRVSKESGVSDGVLFRHFASKEVLLTAWVAQHEHQQALLFISMPRGREGLLQLIQALFKQPSLLSFMYCQPMDIPYLRQRLETCRAQFWYELQARIEQLPCTQASVNSAALTDHLILSIYRAWNPHNPERNQQKERLMSQLPWEKEEHIEVLPAQEVIQRLALNDSGFVFDPMNGRSFSANDVGLYILRFLQHDYDVEALLSAIEKDFDVQRMQAERDVSEFFEQLRTCFA